MEKRRIIKMNKEDSCLIKPFIDRPSRNFIEENNLQLECRNCDWQKYSASARRQGKTWCSFVGDITNYDDVCERFVCDRLMEAQT